MPSPPRAASRAARMLSIVLGERARDDFGGRRENARRDVDALDDHVHEPILAFELHVERRVLACERYEQGRDLHRTVDRRRRYPERPAHGVVARRRRALEPFEVGDKLAPARDIRFTGVREGHTARRPLEQPNSEPRLHPGHALGRTKPSFCLVTTVDKMIPPAAQRSMAKRAGATVTEAQGSHAIFVSRPDVVASVIEQAAAATSAQAR